MQIPPDVLLGTKVLARYGLNLFFQMRQVDSNVLEEQMRTLVLTPPNVQAEEQGIGVRTGDWKYYLMATTLDPRNSNFVTPVRCLNVMNNQVEYFNPSRTLIIWYYSDKYNQAAYVVHHKAHHFFKEATSHTWVYHEDERYWIRVKEKENPVDARIILFSKNGSVWDPVHAPVALDHLNRGK